MARDPTVTPAASRRVRRLLILSRTFARDAPQMALLQAPAGHGKSTALQQIREVCELEGLRTAWVHLDESDNDRRRHANRLRGILSQLYPDGAPARPQGGAGHRIQRRADWLIDELVELGGSAAIFLDEFETLTDRSVLAFWKDFFQRLPANVRVFIASRSMPEVGLARLLVAQRLLLLSAEDLRFSEQEVRQFFRDADDVSLRGGEIETIYRRTEGWPAALQLFRLGLSGENGGTALIELEHYQPRQLSEYIAERVLDLQPEDIHRFLLRTSILPRLTAPLCDLLCQRQDSQAVLTALERSGMFMRAIDHELRWFRYHSLFAAQLREQLRVVDAKAEKALYRQAAEWLQQNGHPDDAMHCAVGSGDMQLAADVLESWSSDLVAGGELATVNRWLDVIGTEPVLKRPKLAVRAAWALVFTSRRKQAAPVLAAIGPEAGMVPAASRQEADTILAIAHMCTDDVASAFEAISRFVITDAAAEGFGAFALAAAENVTAYHYLMRGMLSESRASLIRARSYNRPSGAVFTGGYSACLEGVSHILQGRLGAARDILHSCLVSQRQALDANFASAPLASCCVWAFYESGDLATAKAVYSEYRDMIMECSVLDLFVVGPICMSRIYRIAGEDAEAEDVLSQAEFVATSNGWTRIVELLNWERLRSRMVKGRAPDAATEALYARLSSAAFALPPGCVPFSEMLEGPGLGAIRMAIARGEFDEAQALIVQQRDERPGYIYRQLRLYVLNAQLLLRRGLRPAALRRLRQALEIAVAGQCVRPLLDEGGDLVPLLRDLSRDADFPQSETTARFIARLLELSGKDEELEATDTRDVSRVRLDLLTPREQQLLVYLSQRLTNREMAQRVSLSENTVKFHLKNIFEKLGVSSRLQAHTLLDRIGFCHGGP